LGLFTQPGFHQKKPKANKTLAFEKKTFLADLDSTEQTAVE